MCRVVKYGVGVEQGTMMEHHEPLVRLTGRWSNTLLHSEHRACPALSSEVGALAVIPSVIYKEWGLTGNLWTMSPPSACLSGGRVAGCGTALPSPLSAQPGAWGQAEWGAISIYFCCRSQGSNARQSEEHTRARGHKRVTSPRREAPRC